MPVLIKIIALTLAVMPLTGKLYSQGQDPLVPDLLKVPKGNKMILHTYAKGFQIYTCLRNISDKSKFEWKVAGPSATLYADRGYSKVVGQHYAGPTWEAADGSKVVGEKIQQATPVSNAIPWLLLRSASNIRSGIFNMTTFIQRVNTVGGKAPLVTADKAHEGMAEKVPYTAEYFFYQSE